MFKYKSHTPILTILLCLCILSCNSDVKTLDRKLFSEVTPASSGITFENSLTVNDSMNFFKYGYFYMGGGVAAGDLNGDGLSDLFFTSNMETNACYLNQGQLKFEDITEYAGLISEDVWHTGCNFHDFNADGKLDIYVSIAGIWNERKNKLYINQGNNEDGTPLFKESAEKYGLADSGYSIQSTYLDYDKDGDLDVYVVNYPPTEFNTKVREYQKLSQQVVHSDSDHLYRNNGDGTYTDVTQEAGVLRFGLGIGVVAADFNKDGYDDLYVSNDFHTPDFFYLNNQDGTFTESLSESFAHTSFYGMGVDAADINNDGLLDLYQVDMTTTDNYRSKANMSSMNIPAFWAGVEAGFHFQYMYNSLQVHNGFNPEGQPYFSDIAMANEMHATDWSWACLMGDYDNDGLRDVFVSNGSRREINNKDYFKWLKQTDTKLKVRYKELNFAQLTDKLPSVKTDNHIYKNQGDNFTKHNDAWGIHHIGFSNGATHADLDNDGDLEIIINNIDSTAAIFENHATQLGQHYIKVALRGTKENPLGLGSKVIVHQGDTTLYHDHTLIRGYQSSVDPFIYFGLGKAQQVDSLVVIWSDDKKSVLEVVSIDQLITIAHQTALPHKATKQFSTETLFAKIEYKLFSHSHKENVYDDYSREVLIPHKMSSLGPKVATGDLNADGITDLVVPGPQAQASSVFLSSKNGSTKTEYAMTTLDSPEQEDVNVLLMDLNRDKQLDLVFSSGGNEVDDLSDQYYSQRYYLNDGKGTFGQSILLDENLRTSSAFCLPIQLSQDLNALFIAGRQVPGNYPSAPASYLYVDGADKTEELAKELSQVGMVAAGVAMDYNNDGKMDLIVTGEWMGILFFRNENDKLVQDFKSGISDQIGWWKDLELADVDNDGDMDILCGNLGTNYKYKASDNSTFDIYAKDFDKNDNQDIVLSFYQEGEQFPVRGKQCSSEQIPDISKKFPNYHSFASSTLGDIYGTEELKSSTHYKANQFRHALLINNGNGDFTFQTLPEIFQRYSVNAIAADDVNKDGHLDFVIAGNIYDSEVETPRSDSGYGVVGLGNGEGNFGFLPNHKSGLYIPYECQDLQFIDVNGEKILLAASNNGPLLLFKNQ